MSLQLNIFTALSQNINPDYLKCQSSFNQCVSICITSFILNWKYGLLVSDKRAKQFTQNSIILHVC